jgi:hypothetical protein
VGLATLAREVGVYKTVKQEQTRGRVIRGIIWAWISIRGETVPNLISKILFILVVVALMVFVTGMVIATASPPSL